VTMLLHVGGLCEVESGVGVRAGVLSDYAAVCLLGECVVGSGLGARSE
jgi:hypothetical protein